MYSVHNAYTDYRELSMEIPCSPITGPPVVDETIHSVADERCSSVSTVADEHFIFLSSVADEPMDEDFPLLLLTSTLSTPVTQSVLTV